MVMGEMDSSLIINLCQYFGGVESPSSLGRGVVNKTICVPHRSLFPIATKDQQHGAPPIQNVTLSCWLFCTCDWWEVEDEQERTIIYKGSRSNHSKKEEESIKWFIDQYSNHVVFHMRSSSSSRDVQIWSHQEIPLYKWVHLAVSIDYLTHKTKMFVNGEVSGEGEDHLSFHQMNTYPIYIGGNCDMTAPFTGCIQNMRLSSVNYSSDKLSDGKAVNLYEPIYPSSLHFQPELRVKSKPITSMKQLNAWKPGLDPLMVSTVALQNRPNNSKVKVVHCHDMAGGYLEDALSLGSDKFFAYNFRYWQYIDYFIYFSHYRVTIPPPGWIEASHRNGVKCFATFITEWEQGETETITLLDGPGYPSPTKQPPDTFSRYYADKLIDMAEYYGFDGWFFNIENRLMGTAYVNKMRDFLQYMTLEMHRRLPGSIVMWYDSVTVDGELKWQNELNEKNKLFFDACDAIFLNYCWNPDKLSSSVQLAGDRQYDVFSGIDIFGRNTYGGGGFTTSVALREIERVGSSVALFAPGWTFQTCTSTTACSSSESLRMFYEQKENKFWIGTSSEQLLRNPTGDAELKEWDILENGGNGWSVESDGLTGHCFVTSFATCKKRQTIDLTTYTSFIHTPSPVTIQCGVWYKGTGPNFEDQYFVKLEIRDSNHDLIEGFDSGELLCSDHWQPVSHQFVLIDDFANCNKFSKYTLAVEVAFTSTVNRKLGTVPSVVCELWG